MATQPNTISIFPLPSGARASTIRRQRKGIDGRETCTARRRLQRGSLSFDAVQKRWEGRFWEDEIGPDNQVRRVRRRKILGTLDELETEKMAQRRLDECLKRINSISYTPGRPVLTTDFADEWSEAVLKLQAASSCRAARSHVRCWIKPRLGKFRLDALTQKLVQIFIGELAQTLKRKTVVNVVSTLTSMLRDARSWEYTVPEIRFSELRFPAVGERHSRPMYTPDQVRAVLARA